MFQLMCQWQGWWRRRRLLWQQVDVVGRRGRWGGGTQRWGRRGGGIRAILFYWGPAAERLYTRLSPLTLRHRLDHLHCKWARFCLTEISFVFLKILFVFLDIYLWNELISNWKPVDVFCFNTKDKEMHLYIENAKFPKGKRIPPVQIW